MDIFKMSKIENLNKVSKNMKKKQGVTGMLTKRFFVEKKGDDKKLYFLYQNNSNKLLGNIWKHFFV